MKVLDSIRPVIKISLLCCVVGVMSDAALADRRSPAENLGVKTSTNDKGRIFNLLDQNEDQRVDRAEFRIGIISAFELLDINYDNSLSQAELPSVKSSDFDKADHDKDGRLSVVEFVDADFMNFTEFDQNNDGFVTY